MFINSWIAPLIDFLVENFQFSEFFLKVLIGFEAEKSNTLSGFTHFKESDRVVTLDFNEVMLSEGVIK